MRCEPVKISEMKKRMDVNFHLSKNIQIGDSWALSELKEIIVRDPNCYGFNYCQTGIPIIRIGDLKSPFIDFTEVARISEKTNERFSKTALKKNDILMSVRGVSIGRIGIFLGEYKEANISPNIIIIRLKNKELAPYVALILISAIGQKQVKKIIAGSSKPTITAPLINKIRIPKPSKEVFERINNSFSLAYKLMVESNTVLAEIQEIFEKQFSDYTLTKKSTFSISFSHLRDRWDPHYHNPTYQDLRAYVQSHKSKFQLIKHFTNVQDFFDESEPSKIGYVEIGNVNNHSGIIEEYMVDYVKRLPDGRKIRLQNEDILSAKTRPYRNITTMYQKKFELKMSASGNAFSAYRSKGYPYKYYVLAFLRSLLGLHQVVMKQSGTTYPTVDDKAISTVYVLEIEKQALERIDTLQQDYINQIEKKTKLIEETIESINSNLIEQSG